MIILFWRERPSHPLPEHANRCSVNNIALCSGHEVVDKEQFPYYQFLAVVYLSSVLQAAIASMVKSIFIANETSAT